MERVFSQCGDFTKGKRNKRLQLLKLVYNDDDYKVHTFTL